MPDLAASSVQSESQFTSLVDALAADPRRRLELTDLLREDHPVYDQRGAAIVGRMRGWILCTLARVGLSDAALLFVLEELDTGRDPYPVAAAARALRSYATPRTAFAPFLMRAFENIRYHDEVVSLDAYGEYPTGSTGTTPVREVLATLVWLGPLARGVLPQIDALRATRGISNTRRREWDRVVEVIGAAAPADGLSPDACCTLPDGLGNALSWLPGVRRGCEPVECTAFEDQDGARVTFGDFFRGYPSIVVFFYTRCDNPFKCSLTISKLARIQQMLAEQGLADEIRTAAITYDPAYDLPACLRGYGQSRGVRMDARHRMLRAPDGMAALRHHFSLGVNFIGSLVNRHRIEVYVLDVQGRIAASFERIRWDEQQVIDRAVELLHEQQPGDTPPPARERRSPAAAGRAVASPTFGVFASFGVAVFPKCPVCWAACMSTFGIAGLEQIPYTSWLQPVLVAVMLINLASVWWRGRSTGRMAGFCLVAGGAMTIAGAKAGLVSESAASWGIALTLAGSLLSVLSAERVAPVLSRRLARGW